MTGATALRSGVHANLGQFSLLVLVTAFIGAMVGMERAVLPLVAQREFGIASRAATVSFIVSFGIVKALMNFGAGALCDRWGRKRVLVIGWLIGLPVPLMIMWAPAWHWVVFANVLLGLNQAMCWSTTIIMKTDLVEQKERGLALGWNEMAGYLSVSIAAWGSARLAAMYGLRPWPFLIGVVCAVLGLLLSVWLVRDTHARTTRTPVPLREVFLRVSWRDSNLVSASQAGLVVNLNDGVAWGLLPLLLASHGLPIAQIGLLAAIYPGVRGVSQLAAGWLSDHVGRKPLIVAGLLAQAAAIVTLALSSAYAGWLAGVVLLGLGVAAVYPTLLAAVGDASAPEWRASALGVYRFWRDSGYAIGALGAGLLADAVGLRAAIGSTALVTALAAALVMVRLRETRY